MWYSRVEGWWNIYLCSILFKMIIIIVLKGCGITVWKDCGIIVLGCEIPWLLKDCGITIMEDCGIARQECA